MTTTTVSIENLDVTGPAAFDVFVFRCMAAADLSRDEAGMTASLNVEAIGLTLAGLDPLQMHQIVQIAPELSLEPGLNGWRSERLAATGPDVQVGSKQRAVLASLVAQRLHQLAWAPPLFTGELDDEWVFLGQLTRDTSVLGLTWAQQQLVERGQRPVSPQLLMVDLWARRTGRTVYVQYLPNAHGDRQSCDAGQRDAVTDPHLREAWRRFDAS